VCLDSDKRGRRDRKALFVGFKPVGFHGEVGFISANIQDVHVGPDDFANDYWHYGLWLQDATGAKIGRFNFIGQKTDAVGDIYSALYGILIRGRCLGVRIEQGDIYGWEYGIKTIDNAAGIEGTTIDHVDTTDVNYGIYIVSPTHRVGSWISHVHTASRKRGIWLESQAQVFVGDTLNYKFGGFNGWIGIYFLDVRDGKIHNNMSGPLGTGTATGIALHYNSINNMVTSNSSNDMTTHIWVVDTSSYGNFITGNRHIGTGTFLVDPGAPGSNPQSNNLP
jgi:hypothetical protein